MKKMIALSIALFSLVFVYGQNTSLKEKRVALDEKTEVVYIVSGKNQKNGPIYIKDTKNNNVYMKGVITNNEPSGKWYFSNENGGLESYYNYDQGKLLFVDSAYLKKIDVEIGSQDKITKQNASIPILLYPSVLFLNQLAKNIEIPEEHFGGAQKLPIKIIANIGTSGLAVYSLVYSFNGKMTQKPINPFKNAFEVKWIPARYNDQPLASVFSIDTQLNSAVTTKLGHRRFTWTY